MNVYVVSGHIHYEGSDVIAVFSTDVEAGNFILSCEEHDRKHPDTPPVDSSDRKWNNYQARYKAWRESHPAKSTVYDSYSFEMFTVRES